MNNKIAQFIFYVLLLSTMLVVKSAIGQAINDVESDAANQKIVIQHFYEYDMPKQLLNDKKMKFTSYHIKEDMRRTSFLSLEMANDTIDCKDNTYLIEVESKNNKMKFLYCIKKDTVTLVSVYEFKSSAWVKVKQ